MRIHQRDLTDSQKDVIRAALDKLERNEPGRVCGDHCSFVCPECSKTSCQCQCDTACPHIPHKLSSDPDKHPIEEGIAPLAFEMQRLGVFEPCWSCEGHNGLDGELWKRPAVWFYCDDLTHLRLLADVVENLYANDKLVFHWSVHITYTDKLYPEAIFALEPERRRVRDVKLEDLRADVQALADNLHGMYHEHAGQLRKLL